MIAAAAASLDGPLAAFQPVHCLAGVVVGIALLAFVWNAVSKKPLPGKLLPTDSFQHEDPANADAIAERKRDFSRIACNGRDLWHFTKSSCCAGAAAVLPIELSAEEKTSNDAGDFAYEKLKTWLEAQLPKATNIDTIASRAVYAISVSPGFEFMMKHRVPPMSLPAKYNLLVSRLGQVRVVWYAFITDKPGPGMTSSPWVAKLVSEDLAADRGGRTHTEFTYTAKETNETQLDKIISKHVPLISKGINKDEWDAYMKA